MSISIKERVASNSWLHFAFLLWYMKMGRFVSLLVQITGLVLHDTVYGYFTMFLDILRDRNEYQSMTK